MTRQSKGFSLSEILIALGLLALIAAFTIPKVLNSGNNAKWNAVSREAMAMVSDAYLQYEQDTGVGYNSFDDFTQYFKYVELDTGGVNRIDPDAAGGSAPLCQASGPCMRLHSGAVIGYGTAHHFCNNGSDPSLIQFRIDPDGTESDVDSVILNLYANGKIRPRENGYSSGGLALNNSGTCTQVVNPVANTTPDWFEW